MFRSTKSWRAKSWVCRLGNPSRGEMGSALLEDCRGAPAREPSTLTPVRKSMIINVCLCVCQDELYQSYICDWCWLACRTMLFFLFFWQIKTLSHLKTSFVSWRCLKNLKILLTIWKKNIFSPLHVSQVASSRLIKGVTSFFCDPSYLVTSLRFSALLPLQTF